jgi:hypothetical protein
MLAIANDETMDCSYGIETGGAAGIRADCMAHKQLPDNPAEALSAAIAKAKRQAEL